MVEVRELGPDFHRKTVPGWSGPSSVTDLTSGFHDGHWSMAEITAYTVCGSAAICSSPSAVAGAFRLISMGVLRWMGHGSVRRAPAQRLTECGAEFEEQRGEEVGAEEPVGAVHRPHGLSLAVAGRLRG